jgi:diguanylate cyclase (GGDEF)-like protein
VSGRSLAVVEAANAEPAARTSPEPASSAEPATGECVRQALHSAGEAAYRWDITTDKLEWSADAAEVLGVSDARLIHTGRGYASLLDPDNFTSRFEAVMRTPLKDEGVGVFYQIEYLFRPRGRSDDASCWLEDTGRWHAGSDGVPRNAWGVVRKIRSCHHGDPQVRVFGSCDPLTGMMNRSRMAEALGQAMEAARRQGTSCSFLVATISNLAVVNDAYGYDVADEVIVAVGRRLRQVVRTGDAIGRYSGAKFGLVLANCDRRDLEVAAERFLSVARESVIDTARGPVWAMLSIGGVVLPEHADCPDLAMGRAEEALIDARRLPTDGFVAFRPSPERVSVRGLNARCAAEIIAGLKEDRFTLAYQPIVDARTNQVVMHEGLLRIAGGEGETTPVPHLIPIAEQLGLVRLIDRRIVKLAVEQLRAYPAARLSLNASGITATDPRWYGQLTEILSEQREINNRLTIEITETIALNDLNETARFIAALRELGCSVAIDDFGAGYTSFRNIKVLNIDIVKLDGSFCEDLVSNHDNQYFVRSLLDLARKFELKTVAEWVQNENDAELLKEWGVDYLQGKLFGEPTSEPPWLGKDGSAAFPTASDANESERVSSTASGSGLTPDLLATVDGPPEEAGESLPSDDRPSPISKPEYNDGEKKGAFNLEPPSLSEPTAATSGFDLDLSRLRSAIAVLDRQFSRTGDPKMERQGSRELDG